MPEKEKIITFIKGQFRADRFRVFDNTGQDKEVVGGQFPDVIFKQIEPPPNNNILFVFKIETDGNLVDSVSEWKDLGSAPSVLYIVASQDKINEAKKLAVATNVKARFAWYEMEGENIKEIHYE